jgi:hypothetical protein
MIFLFLSLLWGLFSCIRFLHAQDSHTVSLFFSSQEAQRIQNRHQAKKSKKNQSLIKKAHMSNHPFENTRELPKKPRFDPRQDSSFTPKEPLKLGGIIKDGSWWTVWINGIALSSDGLQEVSDWKIEEVGYTYVKLSNHHGQRISLSMDDQHNRSFNNHQTPLSSQEDPEEDPDGYENNPRNSDLDQEESFQNTLPEEHSTKLSRDTVPEEPYLEPLEESSFKEKSLSKNTRRAEQEALVGDESKDPMAHNVVYQPEEKGCYLGYGSNDLDVRRTGVDDHLGPVRPRSVAAYSTTPVFKDPDRPDLKANPNSLRKKDPDFCEHPSSCQPMPLYKTQNNAYDEEKEPVSPKDTFEKQWDPEINRPKASGTIRSQTKEPYQKNFDQEELFAPQESYENDSKENLEEDATPESGGGPLAGTDGSGGKEHLETEEDPNAYSNNIYAPDHQEDLDPAKEEDKETLDYSQESQESDQERSKCALSSL